MIEYGNIVLYHSFLDIVGERTFPSDASKRGQAVLSGYLGQLPHEALEHILGYLGPAEIGLMETTCRYFLESGIIEQVARHNLRSIPRAKGLTPMFLYVFGPFSLCGLYCKSVYYMPCLCN